jgi:hypothetical protein
MDLQKKVNGSTRNESIGMQWHCSSMMHKLPRRLTSPSDCKSSHGTEVDLKQVKAVDAARLPNFAVVREWTIFLERTWNSNRLQRNNFGSTGKSYRISQKITSLRLIGTNYKALLEALILWKVSASDCEEKAIWRFFWIKVSRQTYYNLYHNKLVWDLTRKPGSKYTQLFAGIKTKRFASVKEITYSPLA